MLDALDNPLRFAWFVFLVTWLVPIAAAQEVGEPPAVNENRAGAHVARSHARLVRIPLPIRGNVDTQVLRVLDQIITTMPQGQERPIVVLEFWPPADGTGASSEFGRALHLARFLATPRLSGVRTVAYLPKTIKGHAVLVALACEEIIMHPDAQIGAAGVEEANIDPTVRRGYSEIADYRRTIPSAVALGMLDPELHVQRVTTAAGTLYVLSEDVAKIQQTTLVQSIDTVIPAGEVGLFRGDRLRLKYNFVSHLASDRQELAAALDVAASELEIDPSLGGEWMAIRVDLHGGISPAAVNRVMRGIDDRMRQESVNFICVSIESPGGSPQQSVRLANYLAELDATRVRTVAYVTGEARADAALVALACDQLVMHADSVLGGSGAHELDSGEIEMASRAIREIMLEKSRPWSLPTAMIDPLLEVHRFKLADTTVVDYFCEEELREQADPERWEKQAEISPGGELLQLNGTRAAELRLARFVVDDFDEFRKQYHLSDSPELLRPNWAHELIAALASPQVAAGLLFIGGFALIAELSAPGIGIGGFISALCFLLFFWSNFLQGTAGWLEVILFISGVMFVAMEIFVIPGFGIFGLGGGAMILASLILASQTFVIPTNDSQFEQVPQSLFTVAAVMAGVITSAVLLRRYLAKAPFFRRVMLAPPEGDALLEQQRRESIVDYNHLLGRHGHATTPLSPAGKADFDGDLIDVISDGEAVARGSQVTVVEVAGNRIVVRAS